MGKKSDSELYVYYKSFRIHKESMRIVSMRYYRKESQKPFVLSYTEKPELQNSENYLPYFKVGTVDKGKLDNDPGFQKALQFRKRFCQENHAKFLRAKAKAEWLVQFENFNLQLERFTEWRKKTSKYNYKNDIGFLQNYVFKFFLSEKVSNNPLMWAEHHNEFKETMYESEASPKGLPTGLHSINI
ncbi:MAG: hypothetical protein H6620_12420 [Halobacteriovoraceae bacterium]|nr:hypothetical protein [Halobacteriovoraceae bacterium]